MPDIATIIQAGSAHAWLYLPVAVILGALHALEPGHAKSLMAAYIVAIRGTVPQAALLAISAAVGHTIVVWALAIAGLLLGEKYIVEQAEPWLMLLSGVLVVLLAFRIFWGLLRRGHHHHHGHGHDHSHDHDHGHDHAPGPATAGGQTASQIVWFGFTGGLLPCPAAIAVLLVCIHLKAFALGIAMVAAFSIGLALTLLVIGVSVAWGRAHAARVWPGLDGAAEKLPYLSAGLVMVVGLGMTAAGLNATGLLGSSKPR